jgi:hypothetical protein
MKNTECTIFLTTKHGYTQRYRKADEGWTQTGPSGVVRRMTAEQLLSHLLPAIAFGHVRLRVVPDAKVKARKEHLTKLVEK